MKNIATYIQGALVLSVLALSLTLSGASTHYVNEKMKINLRTTRFMIETQMNRSGITNVDFSPFDSKMKQLLSKKSLDLFISHSYLDELVNLNETMVSYSLGFSHFTELEKSATLNRVISEHEHYLSKMKHWQHCQLVSVGGACFIFVWFCLRLRRKCQHSTA